MSFRISEFKLFESLSKHLRSPLPQNDLSPDAALQNQDLNLTTDFGFQEKSLLDQSFYRARFAASTQRAERTSQITATSPASALVRDPRVRAMLDVLGFAEGTGNNYGKVVNGTVLRAPHNPDLIGRRNITIDDFSRHPNILVQVRPGLNSTAAGRYQFLNSTWRGLGMPDFSPASQDLAAVKLMQKRGMIEPLLRGDLRAAVFLGAPEWASLPKNAQNEGYYSGQSARTLGEIESVYQNSLRRHQKGQVENPTVPRPQNPIPITNQPANVILNRGERGKAIETLQNSLVRLGHLTREQVSTGPGIFGPRTEAAVKDFQRDNHLPVNGRWDSATQRVLNQILNVVKRGAAGDVVDGLQDQLVKHGYMTTAQVKTGPGIFGPKTEAALRRFQSDHQLEVDGRLGPLTYKALQTSPVASRPKPEGAVPNKPVTPIAGNAYTYEPWNLFSSGATKVSRVNNYEQLLPHHDYQHVTRGGQRLEVRDVVLTRPGEANNNQILPSPLEGRVIAAGRRGGFGNSIEVVNERTKERFLVGHLSRIDVSIGQNVKYGQPIGAQGSTGHSTGPHVHIEAQSNVIRRWVNDLIDGKFNGK
jgi:muramidase (phage lysozyme)